MTGFVNSIQKFLIASLASMDEEAAETVEHTKRAIASRQIA